MPLATLSFAVGKVESSEQFAWYSKYMKSDGVRSHMQQFCLAFFERIRSACCATVDMPAGVNLSALYNRFATRFVNAFTAIMVVVRLELLQEQVRRATAQHFAAEGKKMSAVDEGVVAVRGLASRKKVKTE